MKSYPYNILLPKELVEIVDDKDKVFFLQIYKNDIIFPHRQVSLLIRCKENNQEKFLLHRKSYNTKPLWGLASSYVKAGEAKEDTALTLLQTYYAAIIQNVLKTDKLLLHELSGTIVNKISQTFYAVKLNHHEKSLLIEESAWLSLDELDEAAKKHPTMFHADLLHLIVSGYMRKLNIYI